MVELTACCIDDNELDREIIGGMLKSMRIKSFVTDNIDNFFETVRSQKPSLVFIDLSINSNHDGFDVIKKIKILDSSIIFAATSSVDPVHVTHALEIGASEYIIKPLDYDVLKSKIGRFYQSSEVNDKVTYPLYIVNRNKVRFNFKCTLMKVSAEGVTFYSSHLFSKKAVVRINNKSLRETFGGEVMEFKVNSNWFDKETEMYGHFAVCTERIA